MDDHAAEPGRDPTEGVEMDNAFLKIIPVTYVVRPNEISVIAEIIINWLDLEVDQHIEEKLPFLRFIGGFRNREVYNYVHTDYHRMLNDLTVSMYGQPGACV